MNEQKELDLLRKIKKAAAEMRLTQRIYFKERTRENLISAKEAERALDRLLSEIARYEQARTEQLNRFQQTPLIDPESGIPF